jgi:hypothetical protein
MRQILFLGFIVLSYFANAQTPESLLQKVEEKYTAEKIYLHYDKTSYLAGETIWFKAYLVEGCLPDTKSTVLNVELLNDSGKVIHKKILPVNGSAAIGEFELDKQLRQGSYTVKAYTRILMNFGKDRYYYHSLNIYNPTSIDLENKEENNVAIYFLPEGGNLIAGIKNVIAFKCTDKRGFPVKAEGKIVDELGKEQASFKTSFNGMGKFDFVPKIGVRYSAQCILAEDIKKLVDMPVATLEGSTINIIRQDGQTNFNIDATTVTKEELMPSYILGVQENRVAFKVVLQGLSKFITGTIPAAQLPTGILQITVFNKVHKPLAERLLFINSGDYIPKGSFKTNLVGLTSRAKNDYSFSLEDTIAGSFSVSVTEADDLDEKTDNIVSHFLLTDDIKGYVYQPGYYFENNDVIHQQHLDLVMLTNGWRRYSWNEILTNRFPSMVFTDPGFITLEGKAFNPVNGQPLLNADLSVIIRTQDKKFELLSTNTDSTGGFLLPGMVFEDTAKFTFQSGLTKKGKVNTQLKSTNLKALFNNSKNSSLKNFFIPLNENMFLKIKSQYNFNKSLKGDGILLDEIKVFSKTKNDKDKFLKKYVSGRLGGFANKTLDFITEPTNSPLNIFDYLKNRLNGVTITGGPINYFINYRSARSLQGGPIPMNIFLDEFPVEANFVSTIKIADVALVQVYSNSLSPNPGGTLAIYTKKGDGNVINAIPEMNYKLVEGFSHTKEFFSPDYTNINESEVKEDKRSTLYWNPFLITNEEKKTLKFSFFNSDNAKKFKVVLEGILEDGKLLHLEKIIE